MHAAFSLAADVLSTAWLQLSEQAENKKSQPTGPYRGGPFMNPS
jgi:hypothetical protein